MEKPVNNVITEPKEVIVYRDKVIPMEKVIEKVI